MLSGKESTCNAGDLSSTRGLGRSPGGGHGNPLQDSCLENPMDRRAWWATVHRIVFVNSVELDRTEHSCTHYKGVRTPCLILQISKLFWASVFSCAIRAVSWSGSDKSIWVTVLPSSLPPCTSCWLQIKEFFPPLPPDCAVLTFWPRHKFKEIEVLWHPYGGWL